MKNCRDLKYNEVERLKALARYDVLDTAPESVFDDLTYLAAKVCGLPISLMTLVDEKRQWFKSVVGLNVRETPRSISFCTYTIQQPEIMIVPDAFKDARFANNPLVQSGPKIRFYAGAPLINSEGFKLGTLCVIGREPGHLTQEQKKMLKILADQAMMQLELRLTVRRLAQRSLELDEAYVGLAESEQKFRALFQQAGVGVAQVKVESGQFCEVNLKYCDILGYSPEEMKSLRIEATIFKADLESFWGNMARLIIERPREFSLELRMVQKNGHVVWVSLEVSPLCNLSGPPTACIFVAQDITGRKSAEKQIETALERETLLNREIHHRVKNNLQVISSLLFLQANNIGDAKLSDVLRESQLRIHSVGLIHEKLYRSSDSTQVEFRDYARELGSDLISAYKSSEGPSVHLLVHADGIRLGLDAAVPCGFILTELITNALKHAFYGRKRGQIVVALTRTGNDLLRLDVCDDGVGLPKDFNLEKTNTLGLTLVRDLTRQMEGEIELITHQGTVVRITLVDAKSREHPIAH